MIIAIKKPDLTPLAFSNLKIACEALELKYNTLVKIKAYPIVLDSVTLHRCNLIKSKMKNAGGNLP